MSEALHLSQQVQKALLELNSLIKEKPQNNFNDEMQRLLIIKEMLEEQNVTSKRTNPKT